MNYLHTPGSHLCITCNSALRTYYFLVFTESKITPNTCPIIGNFEIQRVSEVIIHYTYSFVILRKNGNFHKFDTKHKYKCPEKVTTNLIKPVSFYIIYF